MHFYAEDSNVSMGGRWKRQWETRRTSRLARVSQIMTLFSEHVTLHDWKQNGRLL
jgi:hypothetical protein